MGASEAFEGDIEAAVRTCCRRRAAAREGQGAAAAAHERQRRGHGKLNGSEVSYWRQLGALSLLDNAQDALRPMGEPPIWRLGMPRRRCWSASCTCARATCRSGERIPAPDRARQRRRCELPELRGHTMLGDVHAAREEHDAAMAAYARPSAR
jgi:hypothetical protein